jgi:hypothetical protein
MALLQDGWMFRLPVASARHGDFIQAEPRHENAWASGSQTHFIRKVEKSTVLEYAMISKKKIPNKTFRDRSAIKFWKYQIIFKI